MLPIPSLSQYARLCPWPGGKQLVAEVFAPMHPPLPWQRRPARTGEILLAGRLALEGRFLEDPLLAPALADFEDFQDSLGLGADKPVCCQLIPDGKMVDEEHRISVLRNKVKIEVSGSEGVRRALVWLEEEMLKRGGPFLPLVTHHRKPVIRTRISRCFFGPINRPPANRDELADEVDYYPEPYLNRLAHEGVNGLWITLRFQDSVPSRIFPAFAPNGEKRLSKLRATVERCARYGIKIYVFCIEPESHLLGSSIFERHPELRGHVIEDRAAFCVSTKIGRNYLVEAAQTLFRRVPGLGGMIVIPVGERFTQCSSIALPESGLTSERCNCPRCSHRNPQHILRDTLAALRTGMDRVAPDAALISWPYGQLIMWGERMTVESARHVPHGVILQHNFETGGVHCQLGRDRPLCDYWLSVVGPSPVFEKVARSAYRRNIRVSAKLQVGCSHEDATVPFVPVPGLLYSKYQKMHGMRVSAAMQSWYFGNYPSLMTRAAGRLSFAPLPKSESEFLEDLARVEWQDEAPRIVRSWGLFRRAYQNYPATHLFGYYGPVQDGLIWPMHLLPRNRPLTPTWKLDYPVSGDYLADCLSSEFTLREVVTLCERMASLWQKGRVWLEMAYARSLGTRAQVFQRNMAEAIGLQFSSTAAILRFYQMREKVADAGGCGVEELLDQMEPLVRDEILRRRRMIALCRLEPTLGFHSEAEGYKVTPAKLRRGIQALERLLSTEFPLVRKGGEAVRSSFARYTGNIASAPLVEHFSTRQTQAKPEGVRLPFKNLLAKNTSLAGFPLRGTDWKRVPFSQSPLTAGICLSMDRTCMRLIFTVRIAHEAAKHLLSAPWTSSVIVDVEPRRLHPRIQFAQDCHGNKTCLVDDGYLMSCLPPFSVEWQERYDGWSAVMTVPRASTRLQARARRFRFNARVVFLHGETNERLEFSWARRRPGKPRQAWDDANPATDFQWIRIMQ